MPIFSLSSSSLAMKFSNTSSSVLPLHPAKRPNSAYLASADAAMTYLLFALHDQESADLYLKLFCKKSDTARQYVEQWLPIVAAAELGKDIRLEKDFLMKWIDVMEYE